MENDVRTALLLTPSAITEGKAVISVLKIRKKKNSTSYQTESLYKSGIQQILDSFPKPAEDLLKDSSVEKLTEVQATLKKSYTDKNFKESWDTFFLKYYIKYWHRILDGFRAYFPLVKCYHKKWVTERKTWLTAPCSFSNFKPKLQFEVIRQNGKFQLQTLIVIHHQQYPLSIFNRTCFLLENKNEYFILSYADYLTLEKLEQLNEREYESDEQLFALHVIAPLEEAYPVNRNGYFSAEELEVLPVNRLLLKELNNAFLMLTPQWLYDGHLVDGPWQDVFEVSHQGIRKLIKRNRESELAFIQTLEGLHPNFKNQRNGYYYLSFADAQKKQWFQKIYHELLQMDIEIVGMDMMKHFRFSPFQVNTVMETIEEKEHFVLFKMEVSFGKERVPLRDLQRMLIAGQKAVLLKDGSLGVLGEEWLRSYAPMIKHGKIKEDKIEILRWMGVAKLDAENGNEKLGRMIENSWWQSWKHWQESPEPLYAISENIQAALRPYQQKGFEWMLLLNEIGAGACLADDMGLGKTLQAICTIVHFIDHYPGLKHIIVCPASLIYTWQEEMKRFAPHVKAMVYHGVLRQKEQLTDKNNQVIITTYHTMRNEVSEICEQLYGVAVIDESHNIKNPATQIAQSVMQLRAGFRLALSGTPVVNNTFDLYTQLNFVVPGLFGSREFFKREYADPIDNQQDEEKTNVLKRLTAPFILRRTKAQVATDLPEKTESFLWCDMNDRQRATYEDILEQTRSSLFLEIKQSGLAKSRFSILQGITKLRQICSSTALLAEEDRFTSKPESVKTEVLMDELANLLPTHKVLVFSQFSSMLNLLTKDCNLRGFEYFHFDGQTPPVKRVEMVNAFQDPDNRVNLFLISLKAGNTGLTLTSADYVFLFDPWWNTAVEDQAINRTHRIGQTKNVFAYKMICRNTVEEKIIHLQQKKKKLSEDLISAEEGFAKSLTEDDVQYLFS